MTGSGVADAAMGASPSRWYYTRTEVSSPQPVETLRRAPTMAKPSPPPRPQLRAGDVVVLRQSQEHVEGEIITVLGDGRYKVRWLTGSDYQNRVTTVTTEEVSKK
jgi:hypothetical protein